MAGPTRNDDIVGKTYGTRKVLGVADKVGNRQWRYRYKCSCGHQGVAHRHCIVKSKKCPKCRWGDACGIPAGYWSRVRDNARSRGLVFDLNPDHAWSKWLEQGGRCAISKVRIVIARSHTRAMTASLDRIDSTQGYVNGNVQWVHKRVNELKWNLSQDELLYWCKTIVEANDEQTDRQRVCGG